MRFFLRATAIALTLTAAASVLPAQSKAGKVVYINSQALMEAAPGRAQAEALLNKEGEGFRAQVAKMEDSLNARLAAYQKKEPTMTAAQKEKDQKDLQAMQTDLQAANLKLQQQWAQRQSEVMAPITDLVKKVLDDILTEEGYAMILDNSPGQAGSGIVAADKNLDVTDKVVSRLKATPARPLAAPAAAPAPTKGAPAAPAGVQRPPVKPPTQP